MFHSCGQAPAKACSTQVVQIVGASRTHVATYSLLSTALFTVARYIGLQYIHIGASEHIKRIQKHFSSYSW